MHSFWLWRLVSLFHLLDIGWSTQHCFGNHMSELNLKSNMQISLSAISLRNTNAFCTVWIIAYRMIAHQIYLDPFVFDVDDLLVFVFLSTFIFSSLCSCRCMRFCLFLLFSSGCTKFSLCPTDAGGAAWCICALLESLSKLTTCINHYCKTSGNQIIWLAMLSHLIFSLVIISWCCCTYYVLLFSVIQWY